MPHPRTAMSTTLLVIPFYNDAERLAPFLGELLAVLPDRFVIAVSDDGSRAEQKVRLFSLMEEAARGARTEGPRLLPPLTAEFNSGKGRAVIRGWALAEGHEFVAFADAYGAVPAREILRAEEYMRSPGCAVDALFAGRFKMLGRRVDRTLRRHLAGRVFATLVSELSRVPVYDSQCGLKILRNAALRTVYPYLSEGGFAFDVELLLLLIKAGLTVEEFPVDWADVPGSKVSLLRDSWRMARQVILINRRLARMGRIAPVADEA